jgi:transposase-like protein
MSKKRTFDDSLKAKVAIEAIKGDKTISELAGIYEVHPTQIRQWKQHFLENASSIFSRKKDPRIKEQDGLIDELYKKLGKKDIELEFLKKKYKQMQEL